MFNRYTSKQTYRTVPPSLGTPEEARRTVETAEADFEARLVALSAAVSRVGFSGKYELDRIFFIVYDLSQTVKVCEQ